MNSELSQLPDGFAFGFSPPAIPGVGTSGGFTFVLEDRPGRTSQFLAANLQKFMDAARQAPGDRELSAPRFCRACRSSSWTWIATRFSSKAWRLTMFTRPCKPSWAACSSTTSTGSGGNGRCMSKPRASIAQSAENLGQFYVRNSAGEWCPCPR